MDTNTSDQQPVKPANEQEQAAIAWLTGECERVFAETGTYVALTLNVQRTECGATYKGGHAYASGSGINECADGDTITESIANLLAKLKNPDRPTLLRQQAAKLLAEADAAEAQASESEVAK